MKAPETLAQKLGRALERLTRQSGRLSNTPVYGSWLLGKSTESAGRRRVRIQVILTLFMTLINLIGISVSFLLVVVAVPEPSVFDDAPRWLFFVVLPGYIVIALMAGSWLITRQTVNALRWAIEG